MYKIKDDNLRDSFDRHLQSDRNPEQDECLLSALIECVSNSDLQPDDKLKKVESGLIALMKLKDNKRRHDVETGRLLPLEDAGHICTQFFGAVTGVIKNHYPDSILHFVTDMTLIALYDTCKEDERLRRLVFPKWEQAQQQYEGVAREELLQKIEHDRELNLRREQRLLEAK